MHLLVNRQAEWITTVCTLELYTECLTGFTDLGVCRDLRAHLGDGSQRGRCIRYCISEQTLEFLESLPKCSSLRTVKPEVEVVGIRAFWPHKSSARDAADSCSNIERCGGSRLRGHALSSVALRVLESQQDSEGYRNVYTAPHIVLLALRRRSVVYASHSNCILSSV